MTQGPRWTWQTINKLGFRGDHAGRPDISVEPGRPGRTDILVDQVEYEGTADISGAQSRPENHGEQLHSMDTSGVAQLNITTKPTCILYCT